MTSRATRISTLVLGLAVTASAIARSQIIDEGVLEIRRGTSVVGEEKFRIERVGRQGEAVIVRSTARYPPSSAAVVFAAVIELDAEGLPVAAQFDQAGPPEAKTLIRVHDRRFTVRLLSPTGEQSGDYRRPNRLVLWTYSVFAPYLVAPLPVASAVGLAFDGRQVPQIEVVDEGLVTKSFAGRTVRARSVSIRAEGDRMTLWYLENRLIRAEIPSRGLIAVRVPEGG